MTNRSRGNWIEHPKGFFCPFFAPSKINSPNHLSFSSFFSIKIIQSPPDFAGVFFFLYFAMTPGPLSEPELLVQTKSSFISIASSNSSRSSRSFPPEWIFPSNPLPPPPVSLWSKSQSRALRTTFCILLCYCGFYFLRVNFTLVIPYLSSYVSVSQYGSIIQVSYLGTIGGKALAGILTDMTGRPNLIAIM